MAKVTVKYVGPLAEGECSPHNGPGFQFRRDEPVEVEQAVADELTATPVWQLAGSSPERTEEE